MCLGIPAMVLEEIDDAGDRLALVQMKNAQRTVNLGLLDEPVAPGDWVVVHMGFALERISEAEAHDPSAGLEAADLSV